MFSPLTSLLFSVKYFQFPSGNQTWQWKILCKCSFKWENKIWRFPELGIPLNHHFNRSFHYKPTSYCGLPFLTILHPFRSDPSSPHLDQFFEDGGRQRNGAIRFAPDRLQGQNQLAKKPGDEEIHGKSHGKTMEKPPENGAFTGKKRHSWQTISSDSPSIANCMSGNGIYWNMMEYDHEMAIELGKIMIIMGCVPHFQTDPYALILRRPKPSLRHLGVWIGTQMVCCVHAGHVGRVGYLWLRSSTSTSSCLGDSSPILLGLISLLPFDWLKKCLLIIILGNPRVQYNLLVHGLIIVDIHYRFVTCPTTCFADTRTIIFVGIVGSKPWTPFPSHWHLEVFWRVNMIRG